MSLFKKTGKSAPERPGGKAGENAEVAGSKAEKRRPRITNVTPGAAIPGGEISIQGTGLAENGRGRPRVHFGGVPGALLLSSPRRLVVRVPANATGSTVTVETSPGQGVITPVVIGKTIAEELHPVANPALDSRGNIYTTFSGARGQKVATSVFKIDSSRVMRPFLSEIVNATGIAVDRQGAVYISSRMDGSIYQVAPDGHRTTYAQGMGIATGIAFDREQNLYVGDRTGTVFKINRERQIFVFATIEPSVAAYHLAFSRAGDLYVTGPTTSSYDQVVCISPAGDVSSFYRGLGRPQGLAFDLEGNLYVAASLAGQRGVVRVTPQAQAELIVSGYDLVGLAFGQEGAMILATNTSLVELPLGIEGLPLV